MINIKKKEINHFHWIDIIRTLAAILVVFWHYQHFYYVKADVNLLIDKTVQPFYNYLFLFYNHGGLAVKLFWVISGFVFSTAYLSAGNLSVKQFMINRFARLYPVHFVTLVIVAILQNISLILTGEYQIYTNNDLYHFLLNLLFISHWGLQSGWSFNAPIWSVSVELFIYIVFFFTIPLIAKRGTSVIILFLLIFALLSQNVSYGNMFWTCGFYFYGGCLTYYFYNKYNKNKFIILLASFIFAILSLLMSRSNFSWCLLFSSIVLIVAMIDHIDKRNLGKYFKAFGDLSYSIYLWHVPIQITILLLMNYLGINYEYASQKKFFVMFFAIVLMTSYLSYNYIEFPARNYIKNLKR